MAETKTDKLKVFISYSRQDAADFADELVGGLKLAGFAPFIDRHDIKPGEPWEDRLGRLIADSDTVVFVVTPQAVKSERCVWEVDKTLALSKRLLGVVHKPVPEADIPEKLRRLQFVRFDTGGALTRSIAELAEALRVDLDWIREHTRLGELAARWSALDKESLLLRGDDLDAAKTWIAERNEAAPDITEAQRAFIAASEKAESARLGKERQQLEQMARAIEEREAAVAREAEAQKARARARRVIAWGSGVAALLLILGVLGFAVQQALNAAKQQELAEDARQKAELAQAKTREAEANFRKAQNTDRISEPSRQSLPVMTR